MTRFWKVCTRFEYVSLTYSKNSIGNVRTRNSSTSIEAELRDSEDHGEERHVGQKIRTGVSVKTL